MEETTRSLQTYHLSSLRQPHRDKIFFNIYKLLNTVLIVVDENK